MKKKRNFVQNGTIQRRVRFRDIEQIALIERAASSRGMSFQSFVALVAGGVAARVLLALPEDVLAPFLAATSSTPRVRAKDAASPADQGEVRL